ncbi:MAG: UvrABC system protein C [Hyphomicrobiaceae bacterium hypho_1]
MNDIHKSVTVTGPQVISRYLKTLSSSPGVYRMLNTSSEVIYVGKARSLKARVSSYVRLGGHTNRIARMISATASMEFVTVATEAEALLLEANLIKRFRPRFNVLLRDDKSFPYIRIARGYAAPRIMKHRGARIGKDNYFGPFASAGAVDRTINMLQRAFLLRTCADNIYDSRTRPCLLYQIKRCAGPCTGEVSNQEYATYVDEAVRFLKGESQNVRNMYQQMMEEAAEQLEYEQAAKYRNRLWALAHVTSNQIINAQTVEEADIFAAYQTGGHTCIQVFFFRAGQNWGNRAYYPKADLSFSVEDVLESFIAQFYDDKPVPREILLSHDLSSRELLAEALSTKALRKITITLPKRGAKRDLIVHAIRNAKEALGRKMAETSSQRLLFKGIAERFELVSVPKRIEVYDNSHIQGDNAVGAMIVAGQEGFVKSAYRRFNIKSTDINAGDDYAMMREVLTRRFKRLIAESNDIIQGCVENSWNLSVSSKEDYTFPDWPDLVLVDGGLGQLGIAREVANDLGIQNVTIIGVAKGPDRDAGREHFHLPGRARPIMLESRDPILYFIQRLRDEAHRFAIGAHRAKRAKKISANPLDEIPGIGPTRRRALLKHFGSAKAVSRAAVVDLIEVPGISSDMAKKVYCFFHEK